MPTAGLPKPQAALVDRNGLPTREWYSYFLQLRNDGGLTPAQQQQLDELAARVAALEDGGSGGSASIQGVGSIVTQGAPPGIVQITLEGDNDAPGNTWYYGTGPDGTRGWYSLADGFAVTADLTKAVDGSTGVTTFGLAELANSNTGTAIYKTTRDGKGRISGQVTANTDDLPESGTPTNQWFTAARVRAVVLTGLSTATNAAITAADSILSALGKLQAQMNGKEPSITAGTTAQFWRGDKAWANELLGDMTFRSASVNNSYRKAAVTASVLGESLMGLNGYGANGSAEVLGGTLNFRPGQTWTGAASGCDFAIRLNTYSTNTLAEKWRIRGDGAMVPGSDNAQTCGSASLRWSTVYAGTGTINTSDAREKTTVTPLSAAELACAVQLAREIGWFHFHEAVSAKGPGARQHVGMTVQRSIEVMQQHGLDPFCWGFICHDEWEALERIEDNDGIVVQEARPAGDRYSFREGELHGFILRGLAQRQDAIEARIAALE